MVLKNKKMVSVDEKLGIIRKLWANEEKEFFKTVKLTDYEPKYIAFKTLKSKVLKKVNDLKTENACTPKELNFKKRELNIQKLYDETLLAQINAEFNILNIQHPTPPTSKKDDFNLQEMKIISDELEGWKRSYTISIQKFEQLKELLKPFFAMARRLENAPNQLIYLKDQSELWTQDFKDFLNGFVITSFWIWFVPLDPISLKQGMAAAIFIGGIIQTVKPIPEDDILESAFMLTVKLVITYISGFILKELF